MKNNSLGKTVAVVLVILLFLLSTGIVMADGMMNPQDEGQKDVDERMEQCQIQAEECRMFGQFTYEGGTATGSFVEFQVDETSGEIADYTLVRETEKIVVFTKITIESFTAAAEPRVDGAVFIYQNTDGQIIAHDNPPAVLTYTTVREENTLNYTLADGLTASMTNDYNLKIEGGGVDALLLTHNGTVETDGSYVKVEMHAGAQSVFRADPKDSVVGSENQERIGQEIERGHVGAEMSIVSHEGTYMHDSTSYQHGMEMRLKHTEQNRFQVEVEAESGEGKVVVINFDKETIQAQNTERIRIMFDGQEIKPTATAEEVLSEQGNDAVYYIAEGEKGYQALVYIPHFSIHTITVELSDTVVGTFNLNLIAVIAVVAVLGIAVVIYKISTGKR